MSAKKLVVIAGGGTAGHTNPGIAVAQALVELGMDSEHIHFVGGQRGDEATLVPDAGFTISTLPGRGIQRKISLVSIAAALSLVWGTIKGFFLMLRLRPKVVLCLGGYAAFPASLAAVILRRPIVVSEQNAKSSAVNRFFARFAQTCALPFPETDLPKGVLTGNPARNQITAPSEVERARSREKFSVRDDQLLVACWAGSLGSNSVNEAVLELAELLSDRSDIAIYHIVGERSWQDIKSRELDLDGLDYECVSYENDMSSLLHAMDVAICRSGASTVSELAIAGVPSLLIPLPIATRDHQRFNAFELVNVDAAKLIEDSEVSGKVLKKILDPILDSNEVRKNMSDSARSVARPEAANDVAKLMLKTGDINSG